MRTLSVETDGPDMSNVIALNVRPARQPRDTRLAAHATLFANQRRTQEDVFWLKENAEFLNIVEATGQFGEPVLGAYSALYAHIAQKLADYPQYYRFFLSLCLDLEDLGMSGNTGEALCTWVHAQGLPEAELSDLQRAEAERLLARRGVGCPDAALRARLMRFISRADTFAIPNKKAAYELTHIVFYLSEYGRRDPELPKDALRSLNFAGLLAYLDQNHDLLAEICVALRYAGQEPSDIWERSVRDALQQSRSNDEIETPRADEYHAYLVSSWLAGLTQETPFPIVLGDGPARITMGAPRARPLRQMSLALEELRGDDWEQAQGTLFAQLDADACGILASAEASSDAFGAFFEKFVRAQSPDSSGLRLI